MTSEQEKGEEERGLDDVINVPEPEQSPIQEEYDSEYERCLRRIQEIRESVTFEYDSDVDYPPPIEFDFAFATSPSVVCSSSDSNAEDEEEDRKMLSSSSTRSVNASANYINFAVHEYAEEKCPSPLPVVVPSFRSTGQDTAYNLYWADLEEATDYPMEWIWYKCVRMKWEVQIYKRLESWLRGEQPESLNPWEELEPHSELWQLVSRCSPSGLDEIRRDYCEVKYQTALKMIKLETMWLDTITRLRKVCPTDAIFNDLEKQLASSRKFRQECLDIFLDMQGIKH